MEADLPLIEIAGEDDSLLQQIPPTNDVTNNNAFFSLSPLQLPATKRLAGSSRSKSLMDSLDSEASSCSSPNFVDKENMIAEKSEGPKLSMEPQQMKRKTRGGYNLRKSLAWDRAFFTEEGVLDPVELSMISGNFDNSSGEALSVINEELRGSSLSGHKRRGDIPLPPRNSPARVKFAPSPIMQEDLSTSVRNRNVTKSGGCPRPLASFSLKRPANVHTSKGSKKDSKLPKIPGPSSLVTAAKSSILRASNLKHNQIARPALNVQKNVASESSSKNVKCAQSRPKSVPSSLPLSSKTLSQYCRENLTSSPLEVHSLTDAQPSLVKKVDSSLQVTSDLVAPSTTVLSSDGKYKSNLVAGPLHQNLQNTGGNLFQPQKVKPSGLRMPSPSLGYFGQRTAQSGNLPQSATVGQRKFVGDSRPPRAAMKTIKMVNSITSNPKTVGVPSSMQCSELTSNVVADKPTRSDMKFSSNVPKVEAQVSCNKSSKPEVHDVIHTNERKSVIGEHKKMEEIDHQPDAKFPRNSDLELVASGTCEQLTDNNNHSASYTSQNYCRMDLENSQCMPDDIGGIHAIHGKDHSIKHTNGEEERENYSINNDVVTGILIDSNPMNHLTVNNGEENCKEVFDHPSSEQRELIRSYSCETNQVLYGGNNSLKVEGYGFLKDTLGAMEIVDFQACAYSRVERNNVNIALHDEQVEQGNEVATAAGKLSSISNFVVAQPQSRNKILYIANSISNTSTSSEEHPELQNQCVEVEQTFQLHPDLVSEKSQVKEVNKSVHCIVPEINAAAGTSESTDFDATFTQSEIGTQNDEFNSNKIAEHSPLYQSKAQFLESDFLVENFDCFISTHYRKDVGVNANSSETTSCLSQESGSYIHSAQASLSESNLQTIEKPAMTNEAVTAVKETCLIAQDYDGSEVPSSQRSCQFHTVERAHEDAREVNNLNSESHPKDEQKQLLDGNAFVENSCRHASVITDQFLNSIVTIEQFGENPKLSSLCITIDQDCDDNQTLFRQHFNDSEECQQDRHLDSFTDVLPKHSHLCESDFRSSYNSENKGNVPSEEVAQSISVGMEESTDGLEHFTWKQLRQDMECSDQAIYLEYDSDVKMIKGRGEGIIATSTESFSLREELTAKEVQPSSRRSSEVGKGGGLKITLLDETETPIAHSGTILAGNFHSESDSPKASMKDSNERASVGDAQHKNCMMIPLLDVHHLEENNCLQKMSNSDECQNFFFSDSALDECQKETVSDTPSDCLSKHNYVDESDIQICFDLKLKDVPCREGAPSDSFKIESSADHLKHLNDKQCEREHRIGAITIASNSNLAMKKDWSKDVAGTCPEPCSFSEELAVQGAQTSSRRSSQVGVIDGSKRTFVEKFSEDAYSPISKLHNELEYVKDRDSSASVNQSENDLKHNSCIIIPPVDEAPNSGDNHCLFTQNICMSEEFQQENMLKSVEVVLPNYSSVCLNEIQSCVDLEKMDDWPFGEDDPSSSVGIESSADLLEHITDMRLRQDMDHSGQTEYDSALNMRKDMREDVAIRGVFTLSRSRQVHSEDISKWSDEIETKITEGINSPVGKINNDLDDVSASGTDNDELDCSKQSGKDIEHERCITIPPRDAVPFSDEWLAAMEAAGEDILTMKSGAVQNSPPEKSFPEPSPWSPVKRKNTGIGPFDCTKCTLPADLQ